MYQIGRDVSYNATVRPHSTFIINKKCDMSQMMSYYLKGFVMLSFRWRLLVDVVSFLAGSVIVWTGGLMWFVLPPGSRTSSVWSWTRHQFGEVHQWAAAVLLAMIMFHLFLNWSWLLGMICKVTQISSTPSRRCRLILGIVCFVLFFGGMGGTLLIANHMKVVTEEGRRLHQGNHSQVDTPELLVFIEAIRP